MTGDDVDADDDADDPSTRAAAAEALASHLVATETRPVDREAGWRLGEAQALAEAIAPEETAASVVRDTAGEVETLLAAIDETGDEAADRHVDAAISLAASLAAGAWDTDDTVDEPS
mgnify:FL=1